MACATAFGPLPPSRVFYWQGPDGKSKVLVRSTPYGGYAGDSLGDGSERHIEMVSRSSPARHWPYDAMLLPGRNRFSTGNAGIRPTRFTLGTLAGPIRI